MLIRNVLPSNMSTMRKKAKEKEDLPLPVLPQIPTWKQTKSKSSLSHNTQSVSQYHRLIHHFLVFVFVPCFNTQVFSGSVTFCPGLMCALTFLSTGLSVASYRTLRFWILISPCRGQPSGTWDTAARDTETLVECSFLFFLFFLPLKKPKPQHNDATVFKFGNHVFQC